MSDFVKRGQKIKFLKEPTYGEYGLIPRNCGMTHDNIHTHLANPILDTVYDENEKYPKPGVMLTITGGHRHCSELDGKEILWIGVEETGFYMPITSFVGYRYFINNKSIKNALEI